jgi:cytochrome c oxidase subunit 2
MAITPPTERIWWNLPIAKVELAWIIIAFVWGLVMFFMMVYWHGAGEQNLSNEAYRITPEQFAAKTNAMVSSTPSATRAGMPWCIPRRAATFI